MTARAAAERFEIDWSRPWLGPWRQRGEAIAALAAQGGLLEALNAASDASVHVAAGRVRFVDPACQPAGEAYEAFVARTACVPTRNNLHDFFNALVWLAFPAWKRRLNELQAGQITHAGVAGTRGAVRDALTLFDENAALLQAPPELIAALRARDWHTLFVTRREVWAQARITLFGHALLEKLNAPRKAITAHVWLLPEGVDLASTQAVQQLTPERLADKPFLPLPVLGVPSWWPANEDAAFYADPAVFRRP
ncbi:MAG: DUF3025 domain-containing protein [Burkholderiales bacterium]|nr:DUF3025 domain-containing protein [Burkholderiales bacterium]